MIVVDNASESMPEVDGVDDLIALSHNTGFGGGANAGLEQFLKRDEGEWVAVLPHDVDIGDGCFDRIVSVVQHEPGIGLACAEFGSDEIPIIDPYFGGMTVPGHRAGDWVAAGYPHGTFLVARRACLEQVGLFDEAYFAYCEEADLAERARRQGWRCAQVWGAVVRNTDLSSAAVSDYLNARNTLHFVRRWFGRYRAGIRLVITVAELGDPLQRQAAIDFLRGRWGAPPVEVLR